MIKICNNVNKTQFLVIIGKLRAFAHTL